MLNLEKIKDEVDYSKALQRIEFLMFNSVPGSKSGDELEHITKLVERYEDENFLYEKPDRNTEVANSTLEDRGGIGSLYKLKKRNK